MRKLLPSLFLLLIISCTFLFQLVYVSHVYANDQPPGEKASPYAWGFCVQDISDAKGNTIAYGVPTISCVPVVVLLVIRAALMFLGTVAVIMFIYAGYKFVMSHGDPKQAETARKTITYAIVGLLIVIFSFFIISLISSLTGVSCIKQIGFTQCAPPDASQ